MSMTLQPLLLQSLETVLRHAVQELFQVKGRSLGEACSPGLGQPRLRHSLRSQDTARERDAYLNDYLPGVSPGVPDSRQGGGSA